MKQTSALTDDEAVAAGRAQWPELVDRIEKCTHGMHHILRARAIEPYSAYDIVDLLYLRELFERRLVRFTVDGLSQDQDNIYEQFMAWVREEWDAWCKETNPAENQHIP
jgi:hypothetical protein